VQAPKTRRDERDRRGLWLIVGAVVLLALVGAAAAYFLTRSDDSPSESVAQAMQAAGCTYKTYPGLPAGVHISNPNATPKEWNSFPPTSGPHYGQWVIWGEYDQPVRLAQSTHNLEHGGIVIHHNAISGDDLSKLVSFMQSYKRDKFGEVKIIIQPYDKIAAGTIVLTAWGWRQTMTSYDESAVRAFVDAHMNKCCEDVP